MIFIVTVIILLPENSSSMDYLSSKKNLEKFNHKDILVNSEEIEVLNLINEQRRLNGLHELRMIQDLQYVAEIKAKDIVLNNYFAHESPVLGSPFELLQANGVDYKYAGENLAGNINPKAAVEAWMNSPLHKDNILDSDYEYTGIAAVDSPVYGRVYVQFFLGE